MQISSIQSNPYITATSNSNKNSTSSDKSIDYSNLNLNDIKALSYKEVKANYDEIETSVYKIFNTLDTNEKEAKEAIDYLDTLSIAGKSPFSNNETVNKTFFDTATQITNSIDRMIFLSEVEQNLTDYASGKKVEASFMVGDNIHVTEALTKQQRNNINFDDFISKMLSNFGNDVATSGGSVKQQYQGIVDGYSLLKQNYDLQKSEPIYA